MEVAHKSAVDHLNTQKASLESQLSDEKATAASLRDDLSKTKEELDNSTIENQKLTVNLNETKTLLETERQTSSSLRQDLAKEQSDRKQDNDNHQTQYEELDKKSKNDIALKQAVIESLSIDKKKVETKLGEITGTSLKTIADLQDKVNKRDDRIHDLEEKVSQLTKLSDERLVKIEGLEREKTNLIEIAIKCQEAQFKLRHVYEKFPNETDLVKVLFGDSSFNTSMRGSSLYAVLSKQGGSNTKKWADRHFVLNDTFLFYYEKKGDKEPKGVIRMDLAKSVEKIDLSSLGKSNAFRISMRAGRDYFISAGTAEECEKWVSTLVKAIP